MCTISQTPFLVIQTISSLHVWAQNGKLKQTEQQKQPQWCEILDKYLKMPFFISCYHSQSPDLKETVFRIMSKLSNFWHYCTQCTKSFCCCSLSNPTRLPHISCLLAWGWHIHEAYYGPDRLQAQGLCFTNQQFTTCHHGFTTLLQKHCTKKLMTAQK